MEENDQVTIDGCADTNSKKRPRKKFLYSQILAQMEFYFSDANLTRDRFLSQLVEQSKNVPLDVFLRFNKIRALTASTEEIAKALGTSQLLKVTEDGKHVFRTSEVQKKENQDDCIIYVEQLPPDANHDWVRGIFSSYGKVEYVSIPKYKTRPAIKGFAFVEFDTPEAANQALEAFGSAGCCLPPQMAPEELCSVATFEGDEPENQEDSQNNTEHKVEKASKNNKKITGISEQMQVENFEEEEEDDEMEEPESKKLKIGVGESQVGERRTKKKGSSKFDTTETSEKVVADSETVESAKTKKGKKRKLENENNGGVSDSKTVSFGESYDNSDAKKKKKHREEDSSNEVKNETIKMKKENDVNLKEKKSKKKRMDHTDEKNEVDGDPVMEDAEDEGTAKRAKNQTEDDDDGEKAGADSGKSHEKKRARKRSKSKQKNSEKKENDPTSLGLRIIAKNEWRRLRNKYLNLQREKMHGVKNHLARAKFGSNYQSPKPREPKPEPEPESKKTKYIPGVIVHVDLEEPLGEVNSFKSNARTEPGVVYVDVNEGSSEAYIRCNSAEAAQKLVGKNLWNNTQVLKDEAEKTYWQKIWADRQSKINNKMRGIKARGRDKLLKRAERELGKHIKFDD